MRIRRQSFEQLVNQNKREIMENEESIAQLELRIEKRHQKNLSSMVQSDNELLQAES